MDGRSATDYNGGLTCTHTRNDDDKAWWRVDLGNEERVIEVYIVNRNEGNRLDNFEIRVGRLLFALYIQMYKDYHCSVFNGNFTCKVCLTTRALYDCQSICLGYRYAISLLHPV